MFDPLQLPASLNYQFRLHPRPGYIPADKAVDPARLTELNDAKEKVRALEADLARVRGEAPKAAEGLAFEGSNLETRYSNSRAGDDSKYRSVTSSSSVPWTAIFEPVGARLLGCSMPEVRLKAAVTEAIARATSGGKDLHDLAVAAGSFQRVKVHLFALGLIELPASDVGSPATGALTPYGERKLIEVMRPHEGVGREPELT